MMDWNQLLSHIQAGEQDTVKFIREVHMPDDLGAAIVALANTKGGKCFIGIDIINYHLFGSNIDQEWIESMIQIYCSPSFDVDIDVIFKNDQRIVCINVPESYKKPYFYKSVCYIMEGKHIKIALTEKTNLKKRLTLIEKSIQERLEKEKETMEISKQHSQTHKEERPINHRQEKALSVLEKKKTIKNKDYRALFNVSHKTAHIELVDLVSRGHIVSQGAGRSTCYVTTALTPNS